MLTFYSLYFQVESFESESHSYGRELLRISGWCCSIGGGAAKRLHRLH